MKIVISNKNSKLGNIPNISLTPIESCASNLPCRNGCYAMKFYKMYPNVRKAWDHNLETYRAFPLDFFQLIEEYIAKHEPKMFRWHVGGDIPDKNYLMLMIVVAALHPETKFLAFTKQFEIVNDIGMKNIPINLMIVFSGWPGLEIKNPYHFPIAWMQDGTEDRIPDNAINCSGVCENCGMCWNLQGLGRDVYFDKH